MRLESGKLTIIAVNQILVNKRLFIQMLGSTAQSAALSVSELNREAKNLLEAHFEGVQVEGEIGDFTAASSGHWYFTLKDAGAQVRCAMFRGANARVKVRPTKGDSVKVRGRVSLYENRGEFQLIVSHMETAGDGALQAAFEQLKAKLQAEGLFDAARKKPLPKAVRRVGVITSATGAALQDILSVLARRSPMTEVFVFPVPVQGREAPAAISAAITRANSLCDAGRLNLEALVVGRGGGSLEDLWSFNEESVARAIAASNLPIVSAVGHEIDFSIADFTADQRAATPSAAAELITIDQAEWAQRFDNVSEQLRRVIHRRCQQHRQTLQHLRSRLRNPARTLEQQRNALTDLRRRLQKSGQLQISTARRNLSDLEQRLRTQHPAWRVNLQRQRLDERRKQLGKRIQNRLGTERSRLTHYERLLTSLGPENTLLRGYAIVQDDNGNVIRAAHQSPQGSRVSVRLARGKLRATVDSNDT